jgi:drug/metabolite transporter (DMT)-like permease
VGRDDRAVKRGAVLGLLVLYVVWGSTYLAIRYGLESIPPFTMSGFRYACAGAILLAAAKVKGAPRVAARDLVPAFTCGALLLLCGNGGVVWAEQRISSGLAALLIATEPLFIVLLRALPPERHVPGGRALLGVAFGLSGVALLLGPSRLGGGRVDLLGAAVVLFAAFTWALGSLLSRRFAPAESPFQAAALQMIAGGALLLALSLSTGEWARFSPAHVSARSWAATFYLMVFGSLVGYTIYVWLLRVADPSRVSTYAFVNPVVAVFLGWALAGETVSLRTLVAAAVIVVAVVLITLSESESSSAARPVIRRSLKKKEVPQ